MFTLCSPAMALGNAGSSKRPEETVRWAVVHRHVEVKVDIGDVVIDGGQVGKWGHIGGRDGLQKEALGARQHHLRDE